VPAGGAHLIGRKLLALLAELPELALLRDQAGVVQPVSVWREQEGDLDPERYLMTGRAPVRIHRVVCDAAEPDPVFVEVLVSTHLQEVAERLSPAMRAQVARLVRAACERADKVLELAKPYILPLSARHEDALRATAVQSLFCVALQRDRAGDASDLSADAPLWTFLESQCRQTIKGAQAATIRSLKHGMEDAQARAKHAVNQVQGIVALALQIDPARFDEVRDPTTRELLQRLVDKARSAAAQLG